MRNTWLMLFFLFLFTGCSDQDQINNPTAESVLEQNPNADIIQYEEFIYQNASELSHYDELELEKKELIGEIQKQSEDPSRFEDFSANNLPIGTPIYATVKREDTEIYYLIAELDNEDIIYIALVEG